MKQYINEAKRLQQLAGIDEAMQVNPQGRLQDLDAPSGWEREKIDPDQDPEEPMDIETYSAPMEGWDTEHSDVVSIKRTSDIDASTGEPQDVEYYVTTYISFGDYPESEHFDNYDDAKAEAVNIMNNLKSDWRRR